MELEHLGKRIREERLSRGITQEQLAEMADISLNFMSLIENGKTIGKTINVEFGKNGWGLTGEFLEIHKIVSELSKQGYVYLSSVFVDELDDVYEMTFKVIPEFTKN